MTPQLPVPPSQHHPDPNTHRLKLLFLNQMAPVAAAGISAWTPGRCTGAPQHPEVKPARASVFPLFCDNVAGQLPPPQRGVPGRAGGQLHPGVAALALPGPGGPPWTHLLPGRGCEAGLCAVATCPWRPRWDGAPTPGTRPSPPRPSVAFIDRRGPPGSQRAGGSAEKRPAPRGGRRLTAGRGGAGPGAGVGGGGRAGGGAAGWRVGVRGSPALPSPPFPFPSEPEPEPRTAPPQLLLPRQPPASW